MRIEKSVASFFYQDGFSVKESTVDVPPSTRPDFASTYVFAVAKSGSTLVNLVVGELMREYCVPVVDLPTHCFERGILSDYILVDQRSFFQEGGYCYLGFRSLPFVFVGLSRQISQRKILVIRDPRDVLVSLYYSIKYSHAFKDSGTPQFQQFVQELRCQSEMNIDDYCIYYSAMFSKDFMRYAEFLNDPNTMVLRYEEFVFQKRKLVADICEWFSMDLAPDRQADIASKFDEVPATDRPLQHVRQVHPGDHKRKLKASTIAVLNTSMTHVMSTFGYESKAVPLLRRLISI